MPQIQVWINNDDAANTAKLVKAVNEAMSENKDKRLKGFFVFLTDDRKLTETVLTGLAASQNANDVCLTVLSSKNQAVSDYKVSLDVSVKNTVMLYRRKRVVAKEVNLVADEKGLSQLKQDVALLLQP